MLHKNEGYYLNQIQYLYAFAKFIFLVYLGSIWFPKQKLRLVYMKEIICIGRKQGYFLKVMSKKCNEAQ